MREDMEDIGQELDGQAGVAIGITSPGGAEWRRAQRLELLAMRSELTCEMHRMSTLRILDGFQSHFEDVCSGVVALYWPFRAEVDVRSLVDLISEQGGSAALPVVVGPRRPLEFRAWSPGTKLRTGVYGIIPYPAEEAVVVQPDVLLVSLVGFDSSCNRLGYGGGFYDRTIHAAAEKPLTIGIGFELGRLDTIYPAPHDVPLDFVLTESSLRRRPLG